MGALRDAVKKGFSIDGDFLARLDDTTLVHLTAVLDRTCLIEYPQALWVGRQLARLDRITVEPEVLHYRENKDWTARQAAAMRGRWAKVRGTESEDLT